MKISLKDINGRKLWRKRTVSVKIPKNKMWKWEKYENCGNWKFKDVNNGLNYKRKAWKNHMPSFK